jgi:hypothetical protein
MQIRAERPPVLADFWNSADDKLLDSALLFIKGETDYTYLHQGAYLQQRVGFSMQGMSLSDLRTRVRDQLREVYDRCCGEFEIGYLQSFADFRQDVMLWGRICLPLRMSEKDDTTLLLLFCHAIEDKASVFRSLFESSRHPMVAYPVYDDERNLRDAWIIAQNEAASSVTGVYDHARDDLLLRASPIFADERLWAHLAEGLGAGGSASATVITKKSGVRHRLFVEMVGGYIVLHLAQDRLLDAAFEVE